MLGIVTGDDGAARKHLAAAVEITDETTGLANTGISGGDVVKLSVERLVIPAYVLPAMSANAPPVMLT